MGVQISGNGSMHMGGLTITLKLWLQKQKHMSFTGSWISKITFLEEQQSEQSLHWNELDSVIDMHLYSWNTKLDDHNGDGSNIGDGFNNWWWL